MQHISPHSHILIVHHIDNTLPKGVNLVQDLSWTNGPNGRTTDLSVGVTGELEDLVDGGGGRNLGNCVPEDVSFADALLPTSPFPHFLLLRSDLFWDRDDKCQQMGLVGSCDNNSTSLPICLLLFILNPLSLILQKMEGERLNNKQKRAAELADKLKNLQ